EIDIKIPDFTLEPEGLWSKLWELTDGKDIDFEKHPEFSKKYYLRSDSVTEIESIFNEKVVGFLTFREAMHIECHRNKLLVYKKRSLLDPAEISFAVDFAESFLEVLYNSHETQLK
ncbi:MAG: hypothetical protein ACK48F_03065, partial [Chryseotalea sp.]